MIKLVLNGAAVVVWVLISSHPAIAQDTLSTALPEIEIQALRNTETEAMAPFAVALLRRSPEAVALMPALSLERVLAGLPGMLVQDRGHFALGERLAVRGMGARAAFGVRGIQVILDGIPLTVADGQSVVDIVDPAFVRGVELIRGPSSLFWGNGSGGVLFFSTDAPENAPDFRVRVLGGSHGLQQIAAETALDFGRHRVQVYASDLRRDGFRMNSAGRFSRAGITGRLHLDGRTQLRFRAAAADQDAENPGSLTRVQVDENVNLADPRNVDAQAGKQSLQFQMGATLLREMPRGLLSASVYGATRDLDNPLSFAYIQLQRVATGGQIRWQDQVGSFRWGLGLDAALQQDERINTENEGGQPGVTRQLDQVETVRNAAVFGHLSAAVMPRLHLSAGMRTDYLKLSMDDIRLDNGDQSGDRSFAALSPAVGLSYSFSNGQFRSPEGIVFMNYSTAFETPTTTELVNRPDLDGGFNPDLAPQHTRGIEVGTRGQWSDAQLHFDVALFQLWVQNQLVPFQTEEGGSRTFYRNNGKGQHTGLEATVSWYALPAWTLKVTYTGGRYTLKRNNLPENHLPGVPPHQLYVALQTIQNKIWLRLSARYTSSTYVDDENEAQNPGYVVIDLNAGGGDATIGSFKIQPFLAVENMLDQQYNGSVIINARGGRYFEPAPGRTLTAGLNISY